MEAAGWAFWKGEVVRKQASVSSAPPLQRKLEKALQPSVCCLHLVWLGGCAPNEGGWGSSCVWREKGGKPMEVARGVGCQGGLARPEGCSILSLGAPTAAQKGLPNPSLSWCLQTVPCVQIHQHILISPT